MKTLVAAVAVAIAFIAVPTYIQCAAAAESNEVYVGEYEVNERAEIRRIAVHAERHVSVGTIDGGDVKVPRDHNRLGKGHLRLLIVAELDEDHLVRRGWRNMNAGASKWYKQKLGDHVGRR